MKQLKKLFVLFLSLTMLTMLSACGGGNSLADIEKKGSMTVATNPDFPPFEALDGTTIVGIEVDIMEKIAEKLGVEIVFEQVDFESVLPGVQSGKFDVGMSGITVTEKRQKNVDFTMPYFIAAQSIVVPANSDIRGKADLSGKTIAVQTGTTAEIFCMENGYEVLSYQSNNDAASALVSGKAQAWVVDNEVAIKLSAEQNGATVVLDEAMTTEPYAFAFAKDSPTLVEKFNEVITEMIEDGTMQAIFDSYNTVYVAPEL